MVGSREKKCEVDQPNAIKQYNSSVAGADRMDQNIAASRIGIRSKKWWSLFTWFVDVSIGNAHYLYQRPEAYNDDS